MVARYRTLLTCVLVVALGVQASAVLAASPAGVQDAAPDEVPPPDAEYEPVENACGATSLTVEDSELDAHRLESENLRTESTTVRSTTELQPGSNRTFRIESDRLEIGDICINELVSDERDGSRLDLFNVTTYNSTITGPKMVTGYERGEADVLRIYTQLSPEELISRIIGGGSSGASEGGSTGSSGSSGGDGSGESDGSESGSDDSGDDGAEGNGDDGSDTSGDDGSDGSADDEDDSSGDDEDGGSTDDGDEFDDLSGFDRESFESAITDEGLELERFEVDDGELATAYAADTTDTAEIASGYRAVAVELAAAIEDEEAFGATVDRVHIAIADATGDTVLTGAVESTTVIEYARGDVTEDEYFDALGSAVSWE